MNLAKIEQAIASIIEAMGEDPKREGLLDTPKRVAELYSEFFSGLEMDPAEELKVGFEEGYHEIVILKDLPFYSLCEHHFLPFYGTAHIGYIPNGRVVGASKLGRVLDIIAKRPQLQERMTTQIADVVYQTLQPEGVAVVVQAEHLCMTMRGIKKPGSQLVTCATRGRFKRSLATRAEFLALVQSKK